MTLEIDNIELAFKGKPILTGVYVKAETGKITAILGSNGCGKSCLLHIVFGSIKPKYKLIRLNKKAILKPLYRSKTIIMLTQDNFVPGRLSLIDAFKTFHVDWVGFKNTFPQLNIYKNMKFASLSSGAQRIVEVYIALKCNRKIILLDEPFNGIAPLYIGIFKTILLKEKQQKIILLTDHRYDEVLSISDTLYLLKNGCAKPVKNLNELEDYNYLPKGCLETS